MKSAGAMATFRALYRRIRASFPLRGKGASRKWLPYAFTYTRVNYRHTSIRAEDPSHLRRINWVIPNYYGSSGGHRTIFRLTQALERAGYEVHFYIFGETHYVSSPEATEAIRSNYFPLTARAHIGVEGMEPAAFCLASSWETAYAVRDFGACRRKIYFVQDYEPAFFPAGAERFLAEETYRFGFECICAGRWLAQKMREYGNRALSFDLAYDPTVYTPAPEPPAKRRVVFYARHNTARRGTALGLLALALLKEKHPQVEVVLFGSPDVPYTLPFDYTLAGILGERELADLYRGAAVGLSVSLTNYSLIPQEMLACGLPVVEINLPPLRAAYPADTAGLRLAEPTPQAIAHALSEILFLPEIERRRAREAAYGLVERLSWQHAERTLLDLLNSAMTYDEEPLAAA